MAGKGLFQGRLIAIGGNEDKSKQRLVLKRLVKEIGKTDFRVGIVTTASELPEQRAQDYQQVFCLLQLAQMIMRLCLKSWLVKVKTKNARL